jgi:hypothetical protein
MSTGGNKKMRGRRLGIVFMWNVWKERNRRIFDNEERYVPQLSRFLEEELIIYSRASVLSAD